MTKTHLSGFTSEMEKIALSIPFSRFASHPASKAGIDAMRWGFRGGPAGSMNWLAWLGTGLGLASDINEVARKEDPHGLGRSRTERAFGAVGRNLGSFAASGALLKAYPKRTFLAPMLGSIAGGAAGDALFTAPWSHARNKKIRQAVQQYREQPEMQPNEPVSLQSSSDSHNNMAGPVQG